MVLSVILAVQTSSQVHFGCSSAVNDFAKLFMNKSNGTERCPASTSTIKFHKGDITREQFVHAPAVSRISNQGKHLGNFFLNQGLIRSKSFLRSQRHQF